MSQTENNQTDSQNEATLYRFLEMISEEEGGVENIIYGELSCDALPIILNSGLAFADNDAASLQALKNINVIHLLVSPDTDTKWLHFFKDYYKKKSIAYWPENMRSMYSTASTWSSFQASENNLSKGMAYTILYYSTIASAIAFHQQTISKTTVDKLIETFTFGLQVEWLPEEIKHIFGSALQQLKQGMDSKTEITDF